MSAISPYFALFTALVLYAAGTLVAFGSLFTREKRTQNLGLGFMIAGWAAHTVWIGTICARTGHPPLTNLPEAASFMGWTIFAVELILFFKYRVQAASFFVYPLVLILTTISAVVREPFAKMPPALRSRLFTTHVLLSTVGVAALLVGLSFTFLAFLQDRSLKRKTRGPLWEWIPSLSVCKMVGYRALAIGFSVYTLGILSGIMWSYRTTAEFMDLRVKQVSAMVAWILFATVLQSYISGAYRSRRVMLVSAGAFVAVVVAILGIHHV
jgi:ABC-type uncharacterized transport system permease subunit